MTEPMKWRGGANVPSMRLWWWRTNMTAPLASLSLNGSTVVLKAAIKSFVLTPASVAVIYPCQGLPSHGVGIETVDGRVLIFWTREGGTILPALEAAGFSTSHDLRKAYKQMYSRH